MILLPKSVRIFVSIAPVNMHKSFDGLCNQVRRLAMGDPLSGHMFLFLNREATQVKILMWTRGGFTIVHKRLEQGRFQFVKSVQEGVGHVEIDVHEVSMLLEGLDLSALKGANRWSPQPLKAAS